MRVVSSVVAQNRFGELLDNAQREPITITRHGRTVAHIVSDETYRALIGGTQATTGKLEAQLRAIEAFQNRGKGGATARLLQDRRADAAKDA